MLRFRTFGSVITKNIITFQSCMLSSTTQMWITQSNTQTTVDSADVELFSKHMKEWWDPEGPLKPLHSMNLVRIPFVRDGLVQSLLSERITKPLKGMSILDVGCGGGILSEGLARVGATVTGIDASKELIEVAEAHKELDPVIADNKPRYINCTVEDHVKQYGETYDAVVASEVIEHVNNKELFVKSCIKALKVEGRIFFTTPNRTRLSYIGGIFIAENILKIIPKGTHQYEKFITPNELTFLLERSDCHMEAVYGLVYNFLCNTWHFVRSQHVMFAMQAVKIK